MGRAKTYSKKDKVAAIIPAYNEGERIRAVLAAISRSKMIDEIIVVDDGSKDGTKEVVKKFQDITYLKNKNNLGKAHAMDKGVRSTNANILFFCDADLRGLTPEIIEEIIKPVMDGKYPMFIGLRGNFMQSTVHSIAIHSGERAMRRDVWDHLPEYSKHKYRIEVGLNHLVKHHLGGFGYRTFNYSNPIKEEKYGFLRGLGLRLGMYKDIVSVFVMNQLHRIGGKRKDILVGI